MKMKAISMTKITTYSKYIFFVKRVYITKRCYYVLLHKQKTNYPTCRMWGTSVKARKPTNILIAKFNINKKNYRCPAALGPCNSRARANGPFDPWVRRH